jgi:membrane-associated protein
MFDLPELIKAAGVVGVAAIVYTESGLLIGIILPGDSLLFTAGFLASQGFLAVLPLTIAAFIAAVLGDNTGYWLGARFGTSVFSRKDSLLLDPEHIVRAERYFEEHGAKTVVLARFIPVIRTIAPILAGVGSMPRRLFMIYNIVGALLWAVGVTLAGYFLGALIPGVDRYIVPIVLVILITSVLPGILPLLRDPQRRGRLFARMRSLASR